MMNNPMQMMMSMGGANMNNPMQLFQMFMGSPNPMGMMQQMFGGNPMFQQAMQMAQGKSPEQMQEVIQNVAKQKNIDTNQLKQMASQFRLKM